jgi:tetratricopeptide (TPR) repeat protein
MQAECRNERLHRPARLIILACAQTGRPVGCMAHRQIFRKINGQAVAIQTCKRWLVVLATCLPLIGIAGYSVSYFVVLSSAGKVIRNAERLLASGQPEEARQRIRWIVWFQPDHPGANLLIGQSHLELQEYEAAIHRFELIKTTASEYGAARLKLAGCLLNENQLEKAEQVLRQIIQEFPESLPVHRELAVLLSGQLRSDEAVQILLKFFESADELNIFDRIVVLRDLLKSQFLAPLPEDCIESLQAANFQHPRQTSVAVALANCFLRLGREAEAAQVIEQLQAQSPSSPELQILQLKFTVGQRKYADARRIIPEIEQTLMSAENESADSTAKFYLLKSTLEEKDGDYHAAMESLERAATARPLDRASRIRHARMMQQTGDADSASELFATIHRQAEAELALWHLTGHILARMPSREECEKISGLFESLGKATQSNAWRRVAEEIDSATNNVRKFGTGMLK